MKDVTIIMPIFSLTDHRLKNFEFSVNNYLNKIDIPIIVIEQLNKTSSNIPSIISNNSNINYTSCYIDDQVIHKATLINIALNKVKTKYTWVVDADVVFNFSKVLEMIDGQDVIKPFKHIIKLNKSQSEAFFTKRLLTITKGEKVNIVTKFGPMSFIIKTELFKQNKMNENFIGYGWEDFDFAYRVAEKYNTIEFNTIGLHFYHEMDKKNTDQEAKNRAIFFENKKLLFSNIKIEDNSDKKSLIDSKKVEEYAKAKIVHIIAPALLSKKQSLFKREKLAIESIIQEKQVFKNIELVMICESKYAKKYKKDFKVIVPTRTSREIGDKRGLIYLSDLFNEACKYCSDDDIVFYTNSDCCLAPGTYNRLENTKAEAVEYHRRDVIGRNKNLLDVFSSYNKLLEIGVDGIAFRKEFYLKNKYFIPDFFVGEPHWDTAVCGALRTAEVSTQNTIDLFHPEHQQVWDTYNLSLAGQHNDKIYRDFLEYGVSKIPILSKPEEKIETSIVLVHYGSNEKRISATKRAMNKILYQNILDVEFIFVEVVEDKTVFPELNFKSNWNHIVIKEKESNKDIFQKEAMMNIGAKQAKGSIIIFIDSDVWTDRYDWLDSISIKIKKNTNKIVHGFSFCQDTKDPNHVFVSAGLNMCKNIESSLYENPGLVFGVSKQLLEQNDYLNPFHILGGGDSLILHEYLNKCNGSWARWMIDNFPKIKNIIREVPTSGIFDYVNCIINHENHGNINLDYYSMKYYLLEYFTKEIKELVKIGENGLLEWIDSNCIERQINKARFKITTKESAKEVCEEIKKEYYARLL
jgi:hypothetical protein